MKILQFSKMNRAINYYRHWQYGRALEKRGHTIGYIPEADFKPFGYEPTAHDSPEWILANADKYDVLWSTVPFQPQELATLLGLREALGMIHHKNCPLIIDIDDLLMDIPNYNQAGEVLRKNSDRTKVALAALKAADLVTTTCQFLADRVKPHNSNILILPNCVEPALWSHPRPIKNDKRLRVLWSGSGARFGDIQMLKEVLFWLHDKYADRTKLIFTGNCPDFAVPWVEQGFAFVTQWAAIPNYMDVMRYVAADIGLAPLLPNDFNRSKSNLKYLDHAMIGCASVYSDECTYDSVEHGVTGLKATTPAEWQDALTSLIENPTLRNSIASASREDVLARFNIEKFAPTLESLLQEAIDARRILPATNGIRADSHQVRGPKGSGRTDSGPTARL